MPDAQDLLLFVAAGWLLNLAPGPDVLYVVSSALRSGARAGVLAGLGITAGCFVHLLAAALGVGALLATSTLAFTALKWLGAAYLLYAGLRLLLGPPPAGPADLRGLAAARPPVSPRRVFLGGFLTNALNPKVALFFLAFVPQFIAPQAPDKALAFLVLGVVFIVNSIPVHCGYAFAAAWMARRAAVQRTLGWLDRAAGVLFIAFGARLAFADAPSR